MFKIKKNIENSIIIKNSEFITNLFIINNINEVEEKINVIKAKYKDATHHCYGYIINDVKKCSDDNEPTGTAGLPILNILEKNNINYILCIVTRYFGGTLLGAGGLIRAYAKSTSEALKKTTLCELIKGYNITINYKYCEEKIVKKLICGSKINNQQFEETITTNLNVSSDVLTTLNNNNIKYFINSDIYIEK